MVLVCAVLAIYAVRDDTEAYTVVIRQWSQDPIQTHHADSWPLEFKDNFSYIHIQGNSPNFANEINDILYREQVSSISSILAKATLSDISVKCKSKNYLSIIRTFTFEWNRNWTVYQGITIDILNRKALSISDIICNKDYFVNSLLTKNIVTKVGDGAFYKEFANGISLNDNSFNNLYDEKLISRTLTDCAQNVLTITDDTYTLLSSGTFFIADACITIIICPDAYNRAFISIPLSMINDNENNNDGISVAVTP
jgi:hypothetical protein